MTTNVKIAVAAIAGVVVGLLLSGGSILNFGGVYSNNIKDFSEGISVDGTVVIDGSGNVDAPITTTNLSASGDVTFTKSAFCIDGYATSTQTPVKFVASTTATIEGTDGVLVYQFGACP